MSILPQTPPKLSTGPKAQVGPKAQDRPTSGKLDYLPRIPTEQEQQPKSLAEILFPPGMADQQVAVPVPEKLGPKAQVGPKAQRRRTWIKVRVEGENARAADIFEFWKMGREASSKVARAILLLYAIERRDWPTVLEIAPSLLAQVVPGPISSGVPLDIDSESKTESKRRGTPAKLTAEIADLVAALSEVTGLHPEVNWRRLRGAAQRLHVAAFTGDLVRQWHRYCWPQDWRARRGENPTLPLVLEQIAQVAKLPGWAGDSDGFLLGLPIEQIGSYGDDGETFRRMCRKWPVEMRNLYGHWVEKALAGEPLPSEDVP